MLKSFKIADTTTLEPLTHIYHNFRYDAVGAMREMEEFTQKVGGYPFLYADIFMTREEFEKMFDLTNYEIVRKKYHAVNAFPHLYDKVKPEIDVIQVGKDFMDPL